MDNMNSIENLKNTKRYSEWGSDLVRLSVLVPKKLHRAYRSMLVSEGKSMQSVIQNHMIEMMETKK